VTTGGLRKRINQTASKVVPDRGPVRVIAIATFINMVGSGLYLGSSMLFYTRVIGLTAPQTGLGLGIAAAVSIVSGVPLGRLGDRAGAREVFAVLLLVQAAAIFVFPFIRGLFAFVLLICVFTAGRQGAAAVNGALVSRASMSGERTRTLAYLRAVINCAVSLGAALAGFALQINSDAAYIALMFGDGLTFVITAIVILHLPRFRPQPSGKGKVWQIRALGDKPYAAVAALAGLLGLQYDLISMALPLWIVDHTHAPRPLVSITFVINTVLVMALQIRASKSVVDTESGARIVRRAGFVFVVSCTIFGLATGAESWIAVIMLVAAITVHSLGEVWQAAGIFELGYGLAYDYAQGEYQGVFNLVSGLARATAPVIVTSMCLVLGRIGWIELGCILLGGSLLAPVTARWAECTRRPARMESTATSD
jgi:MFS family permease